MTADAKYRCIKFWRSDGRIIGVYSQRPMAAFAGYVDMSPLGFYVKYIGVAALASLMAGK